MAGEKKRVQYADETQAREVAISVLLAVAGPRIEAATDEQLAKAAKKAGVARAQLSLWAAGMPARSAAPVQSPPVIEPEPDDQADEPEEEPETGDIDGLERPAPPEEACSPFRDPEFDSIVVLPAHDLAYWLRETFIEQRGLLYNPDHWHLTDARIGVLWTNVEHVKNAMRVVGQAELVRASGNIWQVAREHYQYMRWFGELPHFVLMFDAPYCAEIDDASFCALVEHELYHCSIKTDRDGQPRETPDGDLVYGMRGHDIEQFVPVAERYGAKAAGVERLVEVCRRRPLIAPAQIAAACGTCLRH